MSSLSRALIVTLLVALSAPALAAQDDFGFRTETSTTRILSPRLNRVVVTEVTPGSAAAVAGLQPGDVVLERNGHRVSGVSARDMAAGLEVNPGQHLHLTVRHPGTGVAALTLTRGH